MQEDNRKVDPTQDMDEDDDEERKIEQNGMNSNKDSEEKNILQDNDKAMDEYIHEEEENEDILKIVMDNGKLTITLLPNVTEINDKRATKKLEDQVPARVSFTNHYYFDTKLDLYIPRNISIEDQHSQVIKLSSTSFVQL